MSIVYQSGNKADIDIIERKLDLYNQKNKPTLQSEDYKQFVVTAKSDNHIIGGGIAYASLYYIGYIDTLWVEETYRKHNVGTQLLMALEKELKNYGCDTCHLETFDFQAPHFYQKNGYEEFGKLYYKKSDLTEYYFKKEL